MSMTMKITTKDRLPDEDRLAYARRNHWYEEHREALTEYVQIREMTHGRIAVHMNVSKSLVSFMCRTLEISSEVRRSKKRSDIGFDAPLGATDLVRAVVARNVERDLVRMIRRYTIGDRGW
jgi:hypothetical protein